MAIVDYLCTDPVSERNARQVGLCRCLLSVTHLSVTGPLFLPGPNLVQMILYIEPDEN